MLGTFMLVFAGTGAIVINDVTGGAITHVGIAFTFGLTVLSVIYAFGDHSGAHINPAVTTAFWIAGRFPGREVLPYAVAQCVGAALASLILRLMFAGHATLGATLPAGPVLQSAVLEFIMTWWLMVVILSVADGAREKGIVAGLVIGSVVTLEAMFGGPISGASMNPARSLGPALVSGQLQHLWLYLVVPVAGAATAVFTCRWVQGDPCCKVDDSAIDRELRGPGPE